MGEFTHQPVMVREVVELLKPRAGGTYVDATVGGGGHALAILQASQGRAHLVGIDRDPRAIAAAREHLCAWSDRVVLCCANYSELEPLLRTMQLTGLDGIVFDLGVSTPQLESSERGFSYHDPNAPLDMRMDPNLPDTAADLVNRLDQRELSRVFWEYGEERWASRIASFVVQARARGPIVTAGQLVECVKAAIPAGARRRGGHPARRIFQALRIAVNGELEHLRRALGQALASLAVGGRIVAISFHSLEDRIVKQVLVRAQSSGQPVPVRVITRRPLRPDPQEVEINPRARSAKLRAAERVLATEGNA